MTYACKDGLKVIGVILCIIIAFFLFIKLGFRNIDEVRLNAASIIEKNGFQIDGYQGYNWDPFYGGTVKYTLTKDNNITYQVKVLRWFDEYHLHKLTAVDAIKPRR